MTGAAHHTRSHAQWSASATARNVHCPGALAMATISPPQPESLAAAWGTVCHEIGERCLREKRESWEFLGDIVKTEAQEFVFDNEMADTVHVYTDYCWGRGTKYQDETADEPRWWIEQNFSFADLNPPFEAGGTGDCVMYFPRWRMVEIIDLKGGRGVVIEVKGNMQARSYALGALLAHADLDIETVRSTIVQPRAPHADGRIRSEEIHVAELVEWTAELRKTMALSKRALDAFEALDGNSVKFDEWAAEWLKPGACTFCPAAGFCPALKKAAFETAKVWFDDLDKPRIGNTLPIESPVALAQTLDGLEALEEWIRAVRAHAHDRAERGEKIPGWILADKIGNRAWIGDDLEAAVKLQKLLKLSDSDILAEPTLKSPAQIEKLIGKNAFAKFENVLWEKPLKGTNLVSETKTTRTRAKSKPEQLFEQLGDQM